MAIPSNPPAPIRQADAKHTSASSAPYPASSSAPYVSAAACDDFATMGNRGRRGGLQGYRARTAPVILLGDPLKGRTLRWACFPRLAGVLARRQRAGAVKHGVQARRLNVVRGAVPNAPSTAFDAVYILQRRAFKAGGAVR